MLDPALCTQSISKWLALKSMLITWLTTPTLIVLPLAVMIGLTWRCPRLPWKPQLRKVGIVILLAYFICTLPLTTALETKALVKFLPPDSGESVDAIVVLGRGKELRKSRADIAAQLWRDHRAPLIFVSGLGDAPQILELIKTQGIPTQVLKSEDCSRTTEENAQFTAIVLQPQGVKRILLVTDAPHMLRSLLTFQSKGFTVIPHSSPLPPDFAQGKKALMVFYEYPALISYSLQGHFRPQSAPVAKTPSQPLSGIPVRNSTD